MTDKQLLLDTIFVNGEGTQTTVCMEECAELIQAISKMKRGKDNKDNLIEEMADVLICMDQLKLIFRITDKEIEEQKHNKMIRLAERLEAQLYEN